MIFPNNLGILPIDTIRETFCLNLQGTGQEFNRGKSRKEDFWEGFYHLTAIESGTHLFKFIVYIDLNMVRAGVVAHPSEWPFCGYNEVQVPKRNRGL